MGHFFEVFHRLQKLLFRQQADEAPDVGRDEARDLLLTGLQLPKEVAGDLVGLIGGEHRRDAQQVLSGGLAHRQMLRHAEKIGKMQRRVEHVPAAFHRVGAQQRDLLQLHRPVDGVFQIAQIEQ